jgi:DNA-binding transcriptional MerR regulator
MGKLYQDETWLSDKYNNEKKSTTEIANICGVSQTTVRYWMDKHGIERRSQTEAQITEGKHNDAKWLREQYIENKRSMRDIADELGMSTSGIKKCLERAGIDRRTPTEHHRLTPCNFITEPTNGYECVSSKCNYVKDQCRVHQLVAIADGANPYKVFSNGRYHIHHENGIHWDNRPCNLTLKSASVHTREHSVDETRHIPDEYDSDKNKEELLSDLRELVVDWRELDNNAVNMCSDELDALLSNS